MFSCEYYKVFKNGYFEKYLRTAASVDCKTFYRATESQIEMKFQGKLKFILYFEQILQGVLVFLLLTLNR